MSAVVLTAIPSLQVILLGEYDKAFRAEVILILLILIGKRHRANFVILSFAAVEFSVKNHEESIFYIPMGILYLDEIKK